jgi:hypothetical protein
VTAARVELLGRVGLVVASSLLALLLVEGALRAFPTVLGQEFANGVLSRYRDGPGGINYWDPALKMAFMRPSFEAEMYYNGYRWRHETDALGFRNDTVKIPADVVLLGDSLIYGHGVDLDQTVGHHLERLTGLRVMNLARQGDCAFHQAYLATAYVGVLRPRHVLYFFFDNDITDLYGHLSEDAMRAYLAWDPALGYPPRSAPPPPPRARWSSRRLYLARAWRFVTRRQAPPPARLPVAVAATNDEDSLGWRYTRKAILQMRDATERHGAAFVMIPLTFQSRHHHDILERFAREHGITLLDVRPVLESDRSFFLPGDGHFTGRGARALAERVAAFLRQRATSAGGGRERAGQPVEQVHVELLRVGEPGHAAVALDDQVLVDGAAAPAADGAAADHRHAAGARDRRPGPAGRLDGPDLGVRAPGGERVLDGSHRRVIRRRLGVAERREHVQLDVAEAAGVQVSPDAGHDLVG